MMASDDPAAPHRRRNAALACAVIALLGLPNAVPARADHVIERPAELKNLTLEELLDLEVTSVSKTAEPLAQTASAVYVITSEDIHRSGAMSLPEALRLAPNLVVSQADANDWAITARGFNGAPTSNTSLANKLLVLIDGRSVYTTLFGGVFWDAQDVMLADVERIEVISGPGGTLWGANAVNGVINVVTRPASETQRFYVSGGVGSDLRDFAAVRYGGAAGARGHFRTYLQRHDWGPTERANGVLANDVTGTVQGGFRADWELSKTDAFTVQGDAYGGRQGQDPRTTRTEGQNVLARWTRTMARASELGVQLYYDRTWRHILTQGFHDDLKTLDLDVQHRFPIGTRHQVLGGFGFRWMVDRTDQSPQIFDPTDRTMRLWSGFLRDHVTLAPERLSLSFGTKLERNDFSGVELQPSARLAWTPTPRRTVWAAVSRAVRAPSRFEADLTGPGLSGNPDFDSEKVTAYELGLRTSPTDRFSLSLATFYNTYTDVRSINIQAAPPPAFAWANDFDADTRGLELSGAMQAATWWKVSGGYAYFLDHFLARDPAVFPGTERFEAIDPRHRATLQSIMDVNRNIQFDLVGHWVDTLPATIVSARVPSYATLDARLAGRVGPWELAVIGRNLFDDRHPEFGANVMRSNVLASVTARF